MVAAGSLTGVVAGDEEEDAAARGVHRHVGHQDGMARRVWVKPGITASAPARP